MQGRFAFVRPDQTTFLEIIPCDGESNVVPRARERVAQLATDPLDVLLVAVDDDRDLDVLEVADVAGRRNALVGQIGPAGITTVDAIIWCCSTAQAPGVPAKQTLERLVCAALARVYPQRAVAVDAWLRSRPTPGPTDGKAYSWSYMAGWDADKGCDAFLREIWKDPPVRAAMESTLSGADATRILGALDI